MKFLVLYHSKVEKDISEAKDWYKGQQEGLQNHYSKEVKKTIRAIISNPLIFQKKYREVRVAYTKIFPFGIHFYVNESERKIIVIGIFHTSLNPKRWKKRL